MTVQILHTNCYTNASTLVNFKICMNNGYDSIFKGLPVSFFDGDPSAGNANLLGPVFYTDEMIPGSCDTFSTIIKSPSGKLLYAAVNNKGQAGQPFPDTAFPETDIYNNMDTTTVIPFSVSILPSDTTVFRFAGVPLEVQLQGGQLKSYNWDPVHYLSCTGCLSPIASPPYTTDYLLTVHNEYTCTATGHAVIKTYSGGNVNIPNGFTPNGDGHNDVFFILGSQDIKFIREFSIFNRLGQMVFHTANTEANNPDAGWNGMLNGKKAEEGTYVYFVTITFTDGKEQQFKGTVTLIR